MNGIAIFLQEWTSHWIATAAENNSRNGLLFEKCKTKLVDDDDDDDYDTDFYCRYYMFEVEYHHNNKHTTSRHMVELPSM